LVFEIFYSCSPQNTTNLKPKNLGYWQSEFEEIALYYYCYSKCILYYMGEVVLAEKELSD